MNMDQVRSSFIRVKDSQMHFLECGQGDPLLFIHGMPTSSFLWRNIIPALSDTAYCCAPDLIGMGQSDKPDIDYTIQDHIDYMTAFISSLGLKDITLVVHGWGSVIGLDYAVTHQENIKAVIFFESHVRPTTDWDMLSLPVQQFASLLLDPERCYREVMDENFMINKLLPSGVVRDLTEHELAEYGKPFIDPNHRKVLWQYILDLPLGEKDNAAVDLIDRYSRWLQQSPIPKLLLYAIPGFITTLDTVSWAKDNFPNLDLQCMDDVMHFAQESAPELFAEKIKTWLTVNKKEVV